MGTSKTDQYTEDQLTLSTIFKALGHPARLAIIDYLLKVNKCICSDIVNELPLAQPTISQHLKELKNAGIIKGSIEGNTICYCLDSTNIEKIKIYTELIINKLNSFNDESNCCFEIKKKD